MPATERIFHAVLYEFLALVFIVPIAYLMTDSGLGKLALVGIALSFYTVFWNYIYNIGFDKVFGTQRDSRGACLRVFHAVLFQIGMVIVTVPAMAWFLGSSIWEALVLEMAFLVFIFFYTIAYNWAYDRVRPFQYFRVDDNK